MKNIKVKATYEDAFGESEGIEFEKYYEKLEEAKAAVLDWAEDLLSQEGMERHRMKVDGPFEYSLWCIDGPDEIYRCFIEFSEEIESL